MFKISLPKILLPDLSVVENRWFVRAFVISLFVLGTYFGLHSCIGGESESKYLNKQQLGVAMALLDTGGDSTEDGKKKLIAYINQVLVTSSSSADTILKPFNSKAELKVVLPTLAFKTDSVFWLDGNMAIVEIIYWALFGLMASILYRVSEAINANNFNSRKVPIHIAKIIYSPLSAIVIIFSFNTISSSDGEPLERINYGVIVLSFILGFFSGRTTDLLKRLKDLLFAGGADEENLVHEHGKIFRIKGNLELGGLVENPPDISWPSAVVSVSSMEDPNFERKYATINDNGMFEFKGLHGGSYTISASLRHDDRVFEKDQAIRVNLKQEKDKLWVVLNERNG